MVHPATVRWAYERKMRGVHMTLMAISNAEQMLEALWIWCCKSKSHLGGICCRGELWKAYMNKRSRTMPEEPLTRKPKVVRVRQK